ncbi:Hap3p TPHA_0H00190, partial [Tetrapisispora phaffii CBS 4417]
EESRKNQFISELREQDRWLPINNVSKLMKNALPMNAKISKDAKECMQECVSEFISFVTSEASDRCSSDKRKTINGEDILISLHALGFENYAEVLKIYLAKYRQQLTLRNQLEQQSSTQNNSDDDNESIYNNDEDALEIVKDNQPTSDGY